MKLQSSDFSKFLNVFLFCLINAVIWSHYKGLQMNLVPPLPLPIHYSCFFSAQAPKVVKVFINLPRSMSFDDAEQSEATQVLDLVEEDCKEDGLVPLRYVKFQNVQSVTVRIDVLKRILKHPE